MRKIIITLVLLISVKNIIAQKYFTRTGETTFKASVEAFEPVEAINKSTTAILKVNTGEIAALLLVKAFHFDIALMQEHFNENYMDSDKFSKATFKGKVEDFNFENLSSNKAYILKGTLTIKGISKQLTTKAFFNKKGDKLILKSNFSVKPEEFDIKIPSIVRKKIAQKINISIQYEFTKK